ncbi:MAG: KOW domain-containing RNA-binding protein [Oscillospiraceae bacterium]|nr:KOW domain-containing RNA-binding protein [Oscillospiraceae bacterium]
MTGTVTTGTIVRSLAGRDKGKFLVVLACEDGTVLLADGDERPVSRPKRKNVKHIAVTGTVTDTAALTDKSLRRLLSGFGNENSNTH